MNKPLMSYVVPVHNSCAYLPECIESLRHQTVKDIEILIVDDASSDSIDRLKDYYKKDDRIKWFNIGRLTTVGEARNYGNDRAQADIIGVLDADDMSMKDRTAKTLKAFKTDIDVFYSGIMALDFYGKALQPIGGIDVPWDEVFKGGKTHISHSSMSYKRSILNDKCRYEHTSKLEDWKFQLTLKMKGYKFGYVKDLLSCIRLLSDSNYEKTTETELKDLKLKWLNLQEVNNV